MVKVLVEVNSCKECPHWKDIGKKKYPSLYDKSICNITKKVFLRNGTNLYIGSGVDITKEVPKKVLKQAKYGEYLKHNVDKSCPFLQNCI